MAVTGRPNSRNQHWQWRLSGSPFLRCARPCTTIPLVLGPRNFGRTPLLDCCRRADDCRVVPAHNPNRQPKQNS
eukprot:scaffold624_cov402-Prasinococcus_capsulatus_cf.AAC.46